MTTIEFNTGTTTRLPRKSNRWPLITVMAGVLACASGLILGRIRYTVPGNYHWSAIQVGNMCHVVSQVTGRPEQAPMCVHARELLDVAGSLLLVGIVMAVTGIAVVVRRLWHRAVQSASVNN